MIFEQLKHQLKSLNNLLSLLGDQAYSQKIPHLGHASIGGHTRHIIELLLCATEGYSRGAVDYLNRKRNLTLEFDRGSAQEALIIIKEGIGKPDKVLNLIVDEEQSISGMMVNTTYYREIVYNTEHAIHHLALIKVALIEMNLNLVDENFGFAYSTLKYKSSLLENK